MAEKTIVMKNMYIHKSWNEPGYHGKMEFESPKGHKIELQFKGEFGKKIMLLVADQLVGEAKKLAEDLTSECVVAKESENEN